MKRIILKALTLASLVGALTARGASSSSPHYHLAADSLPSGGGAIATTHYASRGHISAWSGTPSRTSVATMSPSPGGLGTSFQVIRLACDALPSSVREGEAFQLAASAVLDDGTSMALDASEVAWAILQGPVATVDNQGQAIARHVYQDATATVRGAYQGLQADARVLVLEANPDDYGRYANDGLPDAWQVQHFGENNPQAAPEADPDRDRQDNRYEHIAGTNPTDPLSFFHLQIVREEGLKGLRKLIFGPVFRDRDYEVQFAPDLQKAFFQPLEKVEEQDAGTDRIVVDLSGDNVERYYRVQIEFPSEK